MPFLYTDCDACSPYSLILLHALPSPILFPQVILHALTLFFPTLFHEVDECLLSPPLPEVTACFLYLFLFLSSLFHDFFTLRLFFFPFTACSSSLPLFFLEVTEYSLLISPLLGLPALPACPFPKLYQQFYPPFSPFLLFQAMIFSFLSFLLQCKNNLYIFIVFVPPEFT